MTDARPTDPADHAEDFARRWADRLDQYCATRMEELGIPEGKNGEGDPLRPGSWRAFVPEERTGGHIGRSITVNSGCLNPELLSGEGSRPWRMARPRDRIDAIIAHEWAEDLHGDHEAALEAAAGTELPVTDGARQILRAMGR